LWGVAKALFGEQGPQAGAWVEALLLQLAHGGEAGMLRTLDDLLEPCAQIDEEHPEILTREIACFQNHRDCIHDRRRQQE